MTHTATSPQLPRISRTQARAASLRAAPKAAIVLAGPSVRLEWLECDRPWPTGTGRLRVRLLQGREELWVTLPGLLAHQLMLAVEPALDASGWPQADLAALLLETALLPLLEHWERHGSAPIRLLAADAEPAEPDPLADPGEVSPLAAVTVRGVPIRGVARDWVLTIGGSPEAVDAMLRGWPVQPRSAPALPFVLSVRIGVTDLALATVRDLAPGDAVLVERRPASAALLVVAGAMAASLAPATSAPAVPATTVTAQGGSGWRLMEALRPGGRERWETMDVPTADDVSDRNGDLDMLPVRLVFEAARIDMTLAELRRLGPGAVLETGLSSNPLHVDILANGRRMGRGMLIEVEGALAVQIVTLAGLDDTP